MDLFVIVVFITVTAGAHESQLEGPQNTLSIFGSDVTLKCSSPSRNCNGTDWQKYVPGASPMTIFKGPRTLLNNSATDKDRYSVDNSSGCDLVIKNVQLKDAGRFICSAIMSSTQVTKTAHLIILETQPTCTLNAYENNTVEGYRVQLKCEVTYNGTNNASMIWKGVTDAPVAVKNGSALSRFLSRSYSVVASEPDVPSFTCVTSFLYETGDIGETIQGLATNILNASCSTSTIKVFYSVRNVSLSPSLSNYVPKSIITCTARGHPPPTFKWQEMETNGTWTDILNQNGNNFTMTAVSSKRYRCVAMNVVNGKNYNATSNEIPTNNTESDSTGIQKEDGSIPLQYIMMAVAAGILLLIILLIVCFCNETCPGYKFCNSGNKSKDGLRDDETLTENPDVCMYSVINEGQDIRPKAKSPKRPKGAPPQPKAGNADLYQHEEVTYADLAMEYGPRKVVPQNHGQAAQEESLYAAVSVA